MVTKINIALVLSFSMLLSCTVNKKEYYTNGNVKASYDVNFFTQQKQGSYILFSLEGDTIEKSNFSNNKMEGVSSVYNEGRLHQTFELKNNQLWGTMREYYPNGQMSVELEYYKDRLWNINNVYDSVGNKLDFGKMRNGYGNVKVFDGSGTIIRQGEYSNGYKFGVWNEYSNTGHISEINYDTTEQKLNYL